MPGDIPINKLTQDGDIIDATLINSYYFVTGYTYGATITPSSNPLTEEVNVFYMVVQSGTYTNFGGLVVTEPGFIYFTKGVGYSFQAFSFSGSGIAGVTSVNSSTGAVTLTTDDIPEGDINKYFSGTVPSDISDLTDNTGLFAVKANLADVLTKTNILEYVPSADYHPATKKFVDDSISTAISGISSINTSDIALDVNWETATPPPIQTDSTVTSHIEDTTIHFTEDSIDKYTQAAVDALISNLQSQISDNTLAISNLDAASEDEVLSHIYNLSVHFTKEQMYDYLIQNFDFGEIGQDTLDAMIGDRLYTQNNYVVDLESITASIDKLDMAFVNYATQTDLSNIEISSDQIVNYEQVVKYGALYNWYAATDARKITSSDDWVVLCIGNENGDYHLTEGDLIPLSNEVGWGDPEDYYTRYDNFGRLTSFGAGINLFNFDFRASGMRSSNGEFSSIASPIAMLLGRSGSMEGYSNNTNVARFSNSGSFSISGDENHTKNYGGSIRLVRPATTEELSLANGTYCTPYSGNNGIQYKTVKIGTQVWLAENLAETEYSNGDPIPIVSDNVEWANLTTGGMCYYNNDISNNTEELPVGSNLFTDELLEKLNGIEEGAEVNVQSDYTQADTGADDYIKNKPTLGSIASKDFWTGTQVQYDALGSYDSDTIYFIIEE